mgnify:CR=1 FL=1
MVYYGRALISGRQKLVYGLTGLCAVILLVLNPRIVEAFLLFCFGGVVPGTDIVLSPDTVMWSTVAAIGIFLATIITRMVLSSMRRKWHVHIPVRVVATKVIEVKQFSDEEPVARPILQHASRHRSRQLRHMGASFGRMVRDTSIVVGVMLGGVLRTLGAMVMALYIALAFSVKGVLYGIGRFAVGSLKIMQRAASAIWQKLKPLLWALDAWLEIRVRSLEGWTGHKLRQYETVRLIETIGGEYKKSAKVLRPGFMLQASERQGNQIKSVSSDTVE